MLPNVVPVAEPAKRVARRAKVRTHRSGNRLLAEALAEEYELEFTHLEPAAKPNFREKE